MEKHTYMSLRKQVEICLPFHRSYASDILLRTYILIKGTIPLLDINKSVYYLLYELGYNLFFTFKQFEISTTNVDFMAIF